ncbi:PREDICTED: probable galacturonosyltransferase 5 isoform X2 [Tarenaya hassleriana]|uniref:probable galacturonosyltransferase 5 isoform X2 n=1 Tax=Tarenaya hassleriana TaxID=28532 RepID=UPI00053C1D15|nr:PREDICTED: probable galacturonosyltransferase 5 isoform X2 [Tarenaya hassleriana]
MRQVRRWQGILILSLLSLSVLAPIVFVSNRLKSITSVGENSLKSYRTLDTVGRMTLDLTQLNRRTEEERITKARKNEEQPVVIIFTYN